MNSSFYDYLTIQESLQHCSNIVKTKFIPILVYRHFPNTRICWHKLSTSTTYELIIKSKPLKSYRIHKNLKENKVTISYSKTIVCFSSNQEGFIIYHHQKVSKEESETLELFNRYLKYSDSIR